MQYKLLVSSSVAPFREKAEKIWELKRYKFPKDIFKPTIFFGMFHIGDYSHYIRHLGKRIIFWCGSDLKNLKRKYLLSDGKMERLSKVLSWILWYKIFHIFKAEHFVENEIEYEELKSLGIEAKIKPSFLEDINDFPVYFTPSKKPHVYLSARPGREEEYGVELVKRIAKKVPDIIFHIYGYDVPDPLWGVAYDNVCYHGKVAEERFNEDIKKYHCGLRCNLHDGFSEITAKSVLMGQYPISRIKYSMIDSYETEEELIELLKDLKNKKEPNLKGREYWRKNVNNYPWIK